MEMRKPNSPLAMRASPKIVSAEPAADTFCNLKSQILNLEQTLPESESVNTVFLCLMYLVHLIYIDSYISSLREMSYVSYL